ncbi:MAG: NAD-binding protein, partial [Anaerolineae bacterium]
MTPSTQRSKLPDRESSPSYRWRHWLRQRWQDYRWFVIGGLWLVALILGYIGFTRHFAALGEPRSPADLLYLTLQLFTFESGAVSDPVGWPLEVARWMAPAVTAYTALQTLALLFREQVQLVRLRFFQDHTVICGLGRKGFRLAQGFRQRGERVVVVERDEENDLIEAAIAEGMVILTGDATRPELLRRARVHAAKRLIAVCGDDGVNAEIGVRAAQLAADRERSTLTCILHVTNPQLCALLREREIESGRMAGFRLEFFNIFDAGARALLSQHLPFGESSSSAPHVLIIGLGRFGENVLVQTAKRWARRQAAPSGCLRVTIIDREADRKLASLCLRYPRLGEVCEITPQSIDVGGPAFQRGSFLFDADGRCAVSAMVVCLDDDSLGLSTALTLRQKVLGEGVPIVVRMEQDAGLARLAQGMGGDDTFANLHAFGLLDRTCTPDRLLGGTHEIIARAVHEGYVSSPPEGAPAAVPWEELPEAYRESCRLQADDIGQKLRAVGCALAQLTDWNAEPLQFSEEEVEMMARMEHQRWMEERLDDGWTCGVRDGEKKTNPYLVNCEELPDEIKELNREMVRPLSTTLAEVGLQVVRTGGVIAPEKRP